jgi:hypothetical protein
MNRRGLDWLYRVPDPYETFEDWQRHQHADLATLSPWALENERIKLRLRLAFDPSPSDWLYERLERVRRAAGALKRRT